MNGILNVSHNVVRQVEKHPPPDLESLVEFPLLALGSRKISTEEWGLRVLVERQIRENLRDKV